MFLFAGLPIEGKNSSAETILSILQAKDKKKIFISPIPKIPIKHFDSLISVIDDLKQIETKSTELLSDFIINMQKYSDKNTVDHIISIMDDSISNFAWNKEKYPPKNINDIASALRREMDHLKQTVSTRSAEVISSLKKYEIAKKSLEGTLLEIDVIREEHDFIYEHYVVVSKAKTKEFFAAIDKIDEVSSDCAEIVLSDEKNLLYKIIGLNSNKDAVRKNLIEKGLQYKNSVTKDEHQKKKINFLELQAECDSKKININVYLQTNYNDVFAIYMHSKILKLYGESILTYGLGDLCIFGCADKNKSRLIHYLKNVIKSWKFSERFTQDNDLDDCCAYTFVSNPTNEEDDS